jgi:hypothetical protein
MGSPSQRITPLNFFGCQLVCELKGMPLIIDCWSTRKLLDAIRTMKESMPLGCFQDMYQCIHVADNMVDEEDKIWEHSYADKKHESPRCACHCQINVSFEDGFNKRWKACVQPGRQLRLDESHVAGWYHSRMTIGPKSKPVRTGETIHSLCVDGFIKPYRYFNHESKIKETPKFHFIHTVSCLNVHLSSSLMLSPPPVNSQCILPRLLRAISPCNARGFLDVSTLEHAATPGECSYVGRFLIFALPAMLCHANCKHKSENGIFLPPSRNYPSTYLVLWENYFHHANPLAETFLQASTCWLIVA